MPTADGVTIPQLLHRNATVYPGHAALSTHGVDSIVTWRALRDPVPPRHPPRPPHPHRPGAPGGGPGPGGSLSSRAARR